MEGVDRNSILISSGGEEIYKQIWLRTKVAISSLRFKTYMGRNPLTQPVNQNM